MKKKDPRENVLELKRRARELKGQLQTVEELSSKEKFGPGIERFIYMPDEELSRQLGRASYVHQCYVEYCKSEELEHCNITIFGTIMKKYVKKKRGKGGCLFYTLRPHVFNYLNSLLNSGEELKEAA